MKKSWINFGFVAVMAAFVFYSCGEDTPGIQDPELPKQDALVADYVSTTAFTATLSAKINGVSKTDLALGTSGILYCVDSVYTESVFKSWKEGNDAPDCLIFKGGRLGGDEYNGVIKNLYPDTEYKYCFFLKNGDNSLREISAVSSFRTTPLTPVYKNMGAESVRMFSALLKGTVTLNKSDQEYCTWGLILSDVEDGKLTDDSRYVTYQDYGYEGAPEGIENKFAYLRPATDYWYRLYVEYSLPDNKGGIVYGPENHFSTKTADDWGVDLALPSGILWAKGVLGRQDFEDGYEAMYNTSYNCRWGSVKPRYTIDEEYEYLDTLNNTYINIGDNIEGTEYDIAHVLLGGKWRLPTKEDFEELNAYCRVGLMRRYSYHYSTATSSATLQTSVADIRGSNGQSIIIYRGGMWTGTMSENGENPYCAFYGVNEKNDSAFIELCDTFPRDMSFVIRPVWDPKM